jgi:hypothetical protein
MFGKKDPPKASKPVPPVKKPEPMPPLPMRDINYKPIIKESSGKPKLVNLEQFASGQRDHTEGCYVITPAGKEGYIISYTVNGESTRAVVKRCDDKQEIPFGTEDLKRLKYPGVHPAEMERSYNRYKSLLGQ